MKNLTKAQRVTIDLHNRERDKFATIVGDAPIQHNYGSLLWPAIIDGETTVRYFAESCISEETKPEAIAIPRGGLRDAHTRNKCLLFAHHVLRTCFIEPSSTPSIVADSARQVLDNLHSLYAQFNLESNTHGQ